MIRPAVSTDVDDVQEIVDTAYSPYIARIGRSPAPMTADYAALVAAGAVDVLLDDTVAGLLVTVVEPDHLLIENVAVAPWAQGRGHGRRLLDHAEHRARSQGLVELRLYTNALMTENLALYPRLGYRETGRHTEDGFDRVYFSKALTG
jgi:ribosomal protein S18 acetylase RimI-like enzyme